MEIETSAKAIGARLKKLREARGIKSQSAFAKMLGVSQTRYHNWESGGDAPIPWPQAIEVCKLTGATLDYIYRGEVSALPVSLVTLLNPQDTETSSSSAG